MFSTSKLFLSSNSIKAIGGSVTYDGSYVVHTFTTNDTFELLINITVDILVVAGGGGGGLGGGGGGGGGGVVYQQNIALSSADYGIVIGNGGDPGICISCASHPIIQTPGSNGNNSSFGLLYTAIGGGGGGSHNTGSNFSWNSNPNGRTYDDGKTGGSGGGAAMNWGINSLGGITNPVGGTGTSGQGNAGGNSLFNGGNTNRWGGGGGGSGGAGSGGGARPNGGIGRLINITGTNTYYGGGGGGWADSIQGIGGLGGGGSWGVIGTSNTGGGGGGNASGGSGIVIVRYLR